MSPVALVVSEDLTKLSILKRALKDSFHLIERSDVKAALELLKNTRVDLVILDAKVKEGHSFETAEKIRAAVFVETPILLITSNIKKSFAEAALQSGITDFINEPLDKDEVEQRIAVAFKNQDRPKKISQIAQRSTSRMKSSAPLSKHEFLSDQAIKEITKARKTSTIISLLMIELDEFKKIPASKSTNAHLHLKKVLEENLRKNDILIPQGPGKFILMLPRTSIRAAEIIAETIRTEVLRTSFSIPLSVSIGLISLDKAAPGSADEIFDRLLEGVKRATTEAKKTGNKIVSQ
ncbi:MAG TPA: response regulator [Rhabdochlamydiaceae bacterium]|jgi:two-component system cell cycle response regulator|nr:response regulator [Rhabdochlamydiaceae bacterium]